MAAGECSEYAVHESEVFTRNANTALAREYNQWDDVRYAVHLELERDPKGLRGQRPSGIEQISDTPIHGRRLNTNPPLTMWYEVDDDLCQVHLLLLFRVPYVQP